MIAVEGAARTQEPFDIWTNPFILPLILILPALLVAIDRSRSGDGRTRLLGR